MSRVDSGKGLLRKEVIHDLLGRGREEITRMATDGRKKMDLRSLKKDRTRMYEKLGREVVALAEAGELSHPGLLKGAIRLQGLNAQIESMVKGNPSED